MLMMRMQPLPHSLINCLRIGRIGFCDINDKGQNKVHAQNTANVQSTIPTSRTRWRASTYSDGCSTNMRLRATIRCALASRRLRHAARTRSRWRDTARLRGGGGFSVVMVMGFAFC
jgi:hypothetical protein